MQYKFVVILSIFCSWTFAQKSPNTYVNYINPQKARMHLEYLAGEEYTIADIATWPWVARHQWHDIGLSNYPSLCKWYEEISKREAVIKGYNFMGGGEIPKP